MTSENNTSKHTISKRYSIRIRENKKNAKDVEYIDGNAKLSPSINEVQTGIAELGIGKRTSTKRESINHAGENNVDTSDKCFDIKHIELRHNYITERSTSHPCEICKYVKLP